LISTFLPITDKGTGSLQFRVNDYLALLITLLIRHVCHLNQILKSWKYWNHVLA